MTVFSHQEVVPFEVFLAEFPPGREAHVSGALRAPDGKLLLPSIRLLCQDTSCGGVRVFDPRTPARTGDGRGVGGTVSGQYRPQMLHYVCRNCQASQKVFAVLAARIPEAHRPQDATAEPAARVLKIGEYPFFGPRVPTLVSKFLGPERDLFFKGMRAESQGMGIGAFAYYRRVVESQKERLLNQIRVTAERAGAPQDVLDRLDKAASEDQFSTSVKSAGDAVPSALYIRGQNPLLLLHSALSQGLHGETDEQCAQAARDVRFVLFELAERIERLLEEKRDLDEAVRRLSS